MNFAVSNSYGRRMILLFEKAKIKTSTFHNVNVSFKAEREGAVLTVYEWLHPLGILLVRFDQIPG